MAMSFGLPTSFVSGETALLSLPLLLISVPVVVRPLTHANQVALRMVTHATASKPATTETKKREPRGIMKPRRVSVEMQAFLGGVSEIPRTEVLKRIWAHIKQNNLQDPDDKKVIICDEKLKNIFGARDRVGFLEVAGLISPHFLK